MKEYKFLEYYAVRNAWQLDIGQSLNDSFDISQEIIKDLIGISINVPVLVNLIWQKDDKSLILSLTIESKIEQECSKCLKVYINKINNEIAYEFAQSVDEDDDRIKITSDLTVNLTQPVIDTLVTAIDQFPHCKKTCSGLCPACGVNLNENISHRKINPSHFSHDELDNKPKIV